MRDYSQHGESSYIRGYIEARLGNIPKLFVDIGAHDGITNSNSRMFMEQGWKGLMFEPNPSLFNRLLANNARYDCDAYNIAISDAARLHGFDIVRRKNFEGHSALSEKGTHKVVCLPLGFFLAEGTEIGVLDIDAEGHDNMIADSIINGVGMRPWMVICESNSDGMRSELFGIMGNAYRMVKRIKVNTIWVRKDLP